MKFRAWDKIIRRMCEVISINFEDELVVYKDWEYGISEEISFGDVEFLQSTGLFDKNGKEIYEGDVVHLKSDDGIDYKGLIIYKDGGFCAIDGNEDSYSTRRYQLHNSDCELEVIGNKFEHPHLLGEG